MLGSSRWTDLFSERSKNSKFLNIYRHSPLVYEPTRTPSLPTLGIFCLFFSQARQLGIYFYRNSLVLNSVKTEKTQREKKELG